MRGCMQQCGQTRGWSVRHQSALNPRQSAALSIRVIPRQSFRFRAKIRATFQMVIKGEQENAQIES